jgi:methionine synthase I (cobalamin-dependent)
LICARAIAKSGWMLTGERGGAFRDAKQVIEAMVNLQVDMDGLINCFAGDSQSRLRVDRSHRQAATMVSIEGFLGGPHATHENLRPFDAIPPTSTL